MTAIPTTTVCEALRDTMPKSRDSTTTESRPVRFFALLPREHPDAPWFGTVEGQRVADQVLDPNSPVGKPKIALRAATKVDAREVFRRRSAR